MFNVAMAMYYLSTDKDKENLYEDIDYFGEKF